MQRRETDPHSKSKRGRTVFLFAGLVIIALMTGYFVVSNQKAVEQKELAETTAVNFSAPPPVNVIKILGSPGTATLRLPGETAAWYASIIYARVDGYVDHWFADIGDHVAKGQVLASIDTPDLDAQLSAAQAKLKASIAHVAAKEAEANFAKSTYERWRDSPRGVVSEQERESKKAGYESAVAQWNEAKSQSGLDQANVERFTALAQFKQVMAPFAGVITERRIDIGNLVTAGSNANTTPLYRMEQDNPIRIFSDVPQSAAPYMKAGTPAQIHVSNFPNRVFKGKIARTSEAINPQSRTLKVEVDIPNNDLALVPGMYVDISFEVPTAGLMQVPAAALIFRADGPHLAVINQDDTVAFQKVTIARDNGKTVDLDSGVSVGDRIALNISNQIAEGAKVTVSESGSETGNATK